MVMHGPRVVLHPVVLAHMCVLRHVVLSVVNVASSSSGTYVCVASCFVLSVVNVCLSPVVQHPNNPIYNTGVVRAGSSGQRAGLLSVLRLALGALYLLAFSAFFAVCVRACETARDRQ